MLVQPFVENAIWHGLLNKQGDRKLSLNFSEDAVENLVCIIEDNGIGRDAARKFGSHQHSGKGITTATERLTTYNAYHSVKSQLSIEDLKGEDGTGTGTRIILTLPLL
jgi:two-component system, LytTR family, sensor kinase